MGWTWEISADLSVVTVRGPNGQIRYQGTPGGALTVLCYWMAFGEKKLDEEYPSEACTEAKVTV